MRYRRWLETPSSGVDSYAAVTHTTDSQYPDASLKIADCDRRVSLYFDLSNPKSVAKSRQKLDNLLAVIYKLDRVIEKHEQA